MVPISLLVWTGTHGLYITALSFCMAYDTVQTHGGELSEIEFHESRCEYWRKEGWVHVQRIRNLQAAAARRRARQHPDKGYNYPYFVYRMEADFPAWVMNYVFRAFDTYYECVYYVKQTRAYH